jgi:hypothetical protein
MDVEQNSGAGKKKRHGDSKKRPAAKRHRSAAKKQRSAAEIERRILDTLNALDTEPVANDDDLFGDAALLDVSGIANDETPMAVSILSEFTAPQPVVKKKLGRKKGSNKDKYKPPHVKSIRPKRAGVYIPATERIHPFYSRNPFSDHAAHVSDEFEVMDLDIHTTLGTIIRAANSIKPDNTPKEAKARISTIKRHSNALAHKLSQWKDLMRRTVSADMVQTMGSLMHLRNLTAPSDRECFSH